MKTQTFEEFLAEVHCKTHPEILDDDLSDAFNEWSVEIGVDMLISLGDVYGQSQFNEGIKRGGEVSLGAMKNFQIDLLKERKMEKICSLKERKGEE